MVSINRRLYSQSDYDCQECGRPETDAMRLRVRDFVRPTCDECIARLAHEGHRVSGLMVRVDHVVVAQDPSGQMVERRDTKHVPYREWDARCRTCFP